ncbi:Rieske 2Fe-2S domain-containing protein [Nannocystaceae bacterium ST9]
MPNETSMVPSCWYAIAPSHAIRADRPTSLERLGARWVAWRDPRGELALLRAACPHRGADLALGRVRAGEIECRYHGFRFTATGSCTATPCEGPNATIPIRMRASRPIIREAHGLIWMWHGDEPAELPGLPWIAGAPSSSRRHAELEQRWPVGFIRVMEGMQDIHHLPFAHRRIDPIRRVRLDPSETAITRDDEGVDRVLTVATLRHEHEPAERGYPFRIELGFPGVLRLGLGPRLDATIVVCPIDEARTWIWACERAHTGMGALIDRLVASLSLGFEFAFVQPADRRLLAGSNPQACGVDDHVLVRADQPIAAWHKLRRRRIRARSAIVPACGDASG